MSDEAYIEITPGLSPLPPQRPAECRPGPRVEPPAPTDGSLSAWHRDLDEVIAAAEHHFRVVVRPRADAAWPGLHSRLTLAEAELEGRDDPASLARIGRIKRLLRDRHPLRPR